MKLVEDEEIEILANKSEPINVTMSSDEAGIVAR